MKIGPLFPKKPKTPQKKMTVDEQILDASVRLKSLDMKFRVIIERELGKLRYSRSQKRDDRKAVVNLKNAYYSLGIVRQVQEQLRDISTLQELCRSMNEMSAVLSLVNHLSGRTEKVNLGKLDKTLQSIEKKSGRDGGGMENLFNTSLDSLVDDHVIERLLKGESVEQCLRGDAGCVMEELFPLGEELFQNDEETESLEKSMADIDKLIRNL